MKHRSTLLLLASIASYGRAERMPKVFCTFSGKITHTESTNAKNYTVKIESITPGSPIAKHLGCGYEVGQSVQATSASNSLRKGQTVEGKSTFNGTTEDVPDEHGSLAKPDAPTLTILGSPNSK